LRDVQPPYHEPASSVLLFDANVQTTEKKKKKNLFSTNNIDRTVDEIIKIASLFEEGCQKGQKAINADHLYMFSDT